MGESSAKKANEESEVKKSGLKLLKAGATLFNDGDKATSLYIIQKGQIRLFKPKGKGFIELSVLRSGEVLGEMAYFDSQKNENGERSCSAQAIIDSEVIEISFSAFGKTLESLNPWFRSIIHTLADRLRTTNKKVKDLESNNVTYYGESAGYKFLRMSDVVKCMSMLFLVVKSVGKIEGSCGVIHMNQFRTFGYGIYNLQESKVEAFFEVLVRLGHISMEKDKDGLLKVFRVHNCDELRKMTLFLNTQRQLSDEKKISISPNCEVFLEKILESLEGETRDIIEINLSSILQSFVLENVRIDQDDLKDAIKHEFLEEIEVSDSGLSTKVHLRTLRKTMGNIRLLNAYHSLNAQRARKHKRSL